MAKFNTAVITNKGKALIAKVQAGKATIQFTKIQTGDGSYTGVEDLSNATSLKSMKQEFNISSITIENENTVMLKTLLSNEGLTEGYYIKEIGLYAKDPTEGDILYSITTAIQNMWDYFPPYDDNNIATIILENYATVASASNTTIKAGTGALALAEDVIKLEYHVESFTHTFNAQLAHIDDKKLNKDEVANVLTPKGNIAYATLPTSGNSLGDYYYCPDGDGTNGAGNYVWNGASWFFGGTGDAGYNLLKNYLTTEIVNPVSTWVQGLIYNGYLNASDKHISSDYFVAKKGTKFIAPTGYLFNVNFFDLETKVYIDRVTSQKVYTMAADKYVRLSLFKEDVSTFYVSDAPVFNYYTYKENYINVSDADSRYKKNIEKYYVGADKQYTSFTACIKALKDNMNEKIIYVDAGIYDIFAEFGGTDYALSIPSGSAWYDVNPIIPPNTTIIGLGDVEFHFMPTAGQIGNIACSLLSPINVRGTCRMENITIKADNCRYCIHDETSGLADFTGAKKSYKNVRAYKYSSGGIGYGQAYACGFDANQTFEFENCIFESHDLPMSFHDRYMVPNTCGNIIIKDSIIKSRGNHPYSLRFGNVCAVQRHHKVQISKTYMNGDILLYDETGGSAKFNNFDINIVGCGEKAVVIDASTETNIYIPNVYNF